MPELPKNWAEARVGNVLSLANGFAFKPSHWQEEGLPIIRIQNLNNPTAPFNYCAETLPDRFRVDLGDLLFAWSGTPGTSFGAHTWKGGSAWLNQHIFKVGFSRELFDIRFLQLAINQNLAEYIAAAHGGAGLAHITKGRFEESVLRVAPLNEQRRIVAEIDKQFSRLDDAISALKRVQANLKRYRASVLKAACEGRLVPTEAELARKEGRDYEPASELLKRILAERRAKWEADQLKTMPAAGKAPKDQEWKESYKEPAGLDQTDLPVLSEGWTWVRAEQVCGFITKGTTPAAHKLHQGWGDVPYVKVYNLTTFGGLDFTVNPTFVDQATHTIELSRSKVYPSDVLMNIVGPPLGKVSIVPDQYPEWNVNQAIAIFRPLKGLSSSYLSYMLLTSTILSWATFRAKATAGQFNLTLELCRDLPLPLPPEAEQSRITEELGLRLNAVDSAYSAVEKNHSRARSLRHAVLSAAFSGKLVPQDPNDEPASALLERIRAERALAVNEKTPKATNNTSPANGQRRRRVKGQQIMAAEG
jgi:type I restriction enzyme S subunit